MKYCPECGFNTEPTKVPELQLCPNCHNYYECFDNGNIRLL